MPPATCPDCGKEFQQASWMRKHRVKHQPRGQLLCPHEGCGKRLKGPDTLRQHIKTEHKDQYTHRCPVCNKGFQNRHKMVAHHREHGLDEGPAQRAASRMLGSEAARLLDASITRVMTSTTTTAAATSRGRAAGSPFVVCATCQEKEPRNSPAAFECVGCREVHHWTCCGLAGPPARLLPQPHCPVCLGALGFPRAALALASLGRGMADAYVRELGKSVAPMASDGWCLLRCVAKATGLGDAPAALLPAALSVVADGLAFPDEVTGRRARQAARRLLQRPDTVARHIGTLCNSDVWDHLPRALSRATNRALHVLYGDVRSGTVGRVVVDETGGGGGMVDQLPIVVIRSCHEYNCAHYDLVTEAPAQC